MKTVRKKQAERAQRLFKDSIFYELENKVEELSVYNLIFPYHLNGKEIENWTHHDHTWHHLMLTIMREYEIFSIEGFEEFYSKQEQELIKRLISGLKKRGIKQ